VEHLHPRHVLILGGGPAGLTAARELGRHGISCDVLEADDQVGGISRTVEREGWRFDLGGHRFFTKVPRVEAFWHEVLPDGDFMMRPRMSRIYYNGKYFDYPLRAVNALRNLGLFEAFACFASYMGVRIKRPRDVSNFEGWVASRFGWRLYKTFFKTYTEKVWGVPASDIQADWAAQRIKNLSLGKAIVNALLPRGRNSKQVTSLIEEFQYPKLGPGMMWERCAGLIQEMGQRVHLNSRVVEIRQLGPNCINVRLGDGRQFEGSSVISSVAIDDLVRMLSPTAPVSVHGAAQLLRHRDFLTVSLVVPEEYSFPDNWIYIHSPDVRVGRIQNFGSWSPYLVKEGRTCLGLEYFVSQGDELWDSTDDDLVSLATKELAALGLVPAEAVERGFVVRVPKAYPVYDANYAEAVATIREYLSAEWPMIFPVGRNGMHRYNNQDHSMLTAMLTADNMALGTEHDVWTVNVEEDYHESKVASSAKGTGRDAPFLPAR
jgi:protoporphyrinogen oxidase